MRGSCFGGACEAGLSSQVAQSQVTRNLIMSRSSEKGEFFLIIKFTDNFGKVEVYFNRIMILTIHNEVNERTDK